MEKTVLQTDKDKRRALLDAAQRLFSERSYGKTQISQIAKEAGTGVGTFYRHFADKDSLLDELLRDLFADVRRELADARKGMESLSPIEQLSSVRKTFDVVFQVMLDRPNLTMTYLRSGYGGGEKFSEVVWQHLCELITDMTEDMARAESAGIVTIDDKYSVGHAIIGMVLQLLHRMIVEGAPNKEQAVNMCTRLTFGMFSTFIEPEKLEAFLPLYRMILPPLHKSGDR